MHTWGLPILRDNTFYRRLVTLWELFRANSRGDHSKSENTETKNKLRSFIKYPLLWLRRSGSHSVQHSVRVAVLTSINVFIKLSDCRLFVLWDRHGEKVTWKMCDLIAKRKVPGEGQLHSSAAKVMHAASVGLFHPRTPGQLSTARRPFSQERHLAK